MFWFIILLLVIGAGFFFYQKMMVIEREIRADMDAQLSSVGTTQEPLTDDAESEVKKDTDVEPDVAAEPDNSPVVPPETVEETAEDNPIVIPEVEKMVAKIAPVEDEAMSLEDEILAAVTNLPGIKQTELYDSFTDVERKQLQKLIRDMDEAGKLKREKQGTSYLLYPA